MSSRLYLRLFSVSLLVLFLPIAGIWSLGAFERELLAAEERAMSAQAHDVAAWLSRSAVVDEAVAREILRSLRRPLAGRIRVVAPDRSTLGDTADGGGMRPGNGDETGSPRDRALYRFGAFLWRLRQLLWPRAADGATATRDDAPAIAAALAGRYGALTRPSADGSATIMTVAVPVARDGAVAGAVAVSKSTDLVLAALDRIRIDLFRIVLVSILATLGIAVLLARGIVAPLLRLRNAADRARAGSASAATYFPGTERADEIGDLARSLRSLQERLDARLGELEAFASDVAHELRNPLAAVRSAAELLERSSSDEERRSLSAVVSSEARRIDRIVSSLQELARLDTPRSREIAPGAALEPDREVDVAALLDVVVRSARERHPDGPAIEVERPAAALVGMSGEGAARVVENLLENAISFSPSGGVVKVELAREGAEIVLRVSDQGPGVPAEHRERIFDRFFSWRPGDESHGHLGLGLAIAKAVLVRNGGEIVLESDERSARASTFRVRWPRAGPAAE